MNMFKKNGGFTLVELIVVIAILAILAAVAIPAYSGYITKAQEANDYTALDSVKTACVFAVTEADPAAKITKIEVLESTTGEGDEAKTTISYTVTYTNGKGETGKLFTDATKIEALCGKFTFKSGNKYAVLDVTAGTKWELKASK